MTAVAAHTLAFEFFNDTGKLLYIHGGTSGSCIGSKGYAISAIEDKELVTFYITTASRVPFIKLWDDTILIA